MLAKKITAVSVVLLSAFGLSGCFEDVVDGRHVEISNGQIYQMGEDHPLTGQVTNFSEERTPFEASLNDMIVMMNRADAQSSNVLMGRRLACTINVTDGFLDGEISCSNPNSKIVRYRAIYENGALNGHAEVFDVTGTHVLVEAEIKNGLFDGVLKRYSAKTGKVVSIVRTSAKLLDGKQEAFDENTGTLTYESTASKGKFNGVMKRYSANGSLTYQGEFVAGNRVGIHQDFNPTTGRPTAAAPFVNGRINGVVKKWDESGNLIEEATYRDGVKVFAPSAQAETSPSSTPGRIYQLWCDPQSDYCDLEGKQILRKDLPKYVPFGGSDDCMLEICVNSNQEVVGLNPEYYQK
ncbi:hypothetical protein C1893_10565 [Pseudomonas sp. MPR-ANC1]|uniref:toxin-antitoxin system YwqK family antitoxin n=1 Tax=Pseudomonas sp. MPR-ANC1 TaxID=2075548 RepID=UPI000CD0AE8F|nr:toxin-antitoxin system YwqK family antitoxin [Pseudomonas sp. MPR-ANC1]POA48296.1 hypothetical protein C1893_10565 [Pseudomonas sp. MPR-ANC1]